MTFNSLSDLTEYIKRDKYLVTDAMFQEAMDARRLYKPGEISETTGLQKQPDGSWAEPNKEQKQTIPDNQQIELEKFAANVRVPGLDSDKAEILINVINDKWVQYGLKKLGSIELAKKGKPSSGSFLKIELNLDTINHPEVTIGREKQRVAYAENMISRIDKHLKTLKLTDSKRKEYKQLKRKYERLKRVPGHVNIHGHITECEIVHEIGHVIADQKIGMINRELANSNYKPIDSNRLYRLNKRVLYTYLFAKIHGDTDKLSFYAGVNRKEFFAEAFVMYTFEPHKMPRYIKNMVEAVIK